MTLLLPVGSWNGVIQLNALSTKWSCNWGTTAEMTPQNCRLKRPHRRRLNQAIKLGPRHPEVLLLKLHDRQINSPQL